MPLFFNKAFHSFDHLAGQSCVIHFVKQVDKAGYPRAAEHVFTFVIAVEQMIIHPPDTCATCEPLSKCDHYPIAK